MPRPVMAHPLRPCDANEDNRLHLAGHKARFFLTVYDRGLRLTRTAAAARGPRCSRPTPIADVFGRGRVLCYVRHRTEYA